MRYMVIIEQGPKGPTSFGAYVPDLPGCIAAAETKQEVLKLIQEAIEFHLEGRRSKVCLCLSHILTANSWKFMPDKGTSLLKA